MKKAKEKRAVDESEMEHTCCTLLAEFMGLA